VERPARLANGLRLPSGWREVTSPLPMAEGIDPLVGRSLGLPAFRAKRAEALPPQWVAFVVDSVGQVATCSVRAYDVALSAAALERAVVPLRYQPAEVGGRRVNQLMLVAVAR